MIIEGNQKEIAAMMEFHKGNRQKGLELHASNDKCKD